MSRQSIASPHSRFGFIEQGGLSTQDIGRNEAVEKLCHPCPTDSEITGEGRPTFELAEVEKRLIEMGEPKGGAGLFYPVFGSHDWQPEHFRYKR